MSARTGPWKEILSTVTIPDTNAHAMTTFRALGNSIKLFITTGTGGCGSLTFTAYTSDHETTGFCQVIDRDSVWSQVSTVPTTAGSYELDLEGLDVVPLQYVKLYYQAASAAGTLQINALNWENPKGGGISVSVPDVVVDVNNIDVNIEGVEQAHSDAVGAMGFMQVVEAKDFDGSALPNDVSEGDVVRPAASMYGVSYMMPVSETGAETPLVAHDAAISAAVGGSSGFMAMGETKTVDGSALPNSANAEGDAVRPAMSLGGAALSVPVTQSGLATAIIAIDEAPATGVGAAVVMGGYTAKDFDGSAVPAAAGTEGDAAAAAVSLAGVTFATITNEDLTTTPLIAHDEAVAAGVGGTTIATSCNSQAFDGSAIAAVGTELDAVKPSASLYGVQYTMPVYQDGSSTPMIAQDAAITAGAGQMPFMIAAETKTIDGGALPNTCNAEGDGVRIAASLAGVVYTHPVTASGSDGAIALHDAAIASGVATAAVMQGLESVDIDGGVIPNAVNAEGDIVRAKGTLSGVAMVAVVSEAGEYIMPTMDANGRAGFVKITDATTDGDVLPLSAAVKPTGALGVAGEIADFDSGAGEDFTAAIGVLGAKSGGSVPIPAGDVVANSIFVAVGDNTTTATVSTDGTKKALNVNVTDGTNDMPTMDDKARAGYVEITDGTTVATVTTGTIKGLNAVISDGETVGDVIVTSAAAQPSSILGVGGEVVDFDTAGTDLTAAIGVLAATATGAKPILADTDGHLQIDVLTDPMTDGLYADDADWSDGSSKHVLTGGLYQSSPQSITDGDVGPFQVDSKGNIKAVITDGTNSVSVGAGTIKGINAIVSDGESVVDVITSGAAAQPSNVLGVAGEIVDFDTAGTDLTAAIGILGATATGAKPILADNDGHLQIDALSTPLDGAIYVDDDDWTDSSSKHLLVGGLYQSAQQSITDGDVGPIQLDSKGNVSVTDNIHWGSVGAASDIDGVAHGQLRYIADLLELPLAPSPYFDSDGDNTAQALKASPGKLYKLQVINSNAADAYVQLFDLATGGVTVGVTTPYYVLYVPAQGAVIDDYFHGINFATAITYACTTTATGAGDPAVGLTVSALYK